MSDRLSPEQEEEIHQQLSEGRKIAAIKLYREATGLDLKEAKEAVEKIADEQQAMAPARFAERQAGGGGCLGMLALFVVVALLITQLT